MGNKLIPCTSNAYSSVILIEGKMNWCFCQNKYLSHTCFRLSSVAFPWKEETNFIQYKFSSIIVLFYFQKNLGFFVFYVWFIFKSFNTYIYQVFIWWQKAKQTAKRMDLCIKVPEYQNENCLHLKANSLCSASQSYNLSMPFRHKWYTCSQQQVTQHSTEAKILYEILFFPEI